MCVVGRVCNVLLMMDANVVGFVLGIDGTRYFAHEFSSSCAF